MVGRRENRLSVPRLSSAAGHSVMGNTSLPISEIQTIVPKDISEDELKEFYNAFIARHRRASDYFITRVERIKNAIVKDRGLDSIFKDNAAEIIIDVALIASFAKLLSERLISSGTELPVSE